MGLNPSEGANYIGESIGLHNLVPSAITTRVLHYSRLKALQNIYAKIVRLVDHWNNVERRTTRLGGVVSSDTQFYFAIKKNNKTEARNVLTVHEPLSEGRITET